MSDDLGQAILELATDMSEYVKDLDNAKGKAQDLDAKFSDVADTAKKLGEGIGIVGGAVSGAMLAMAKETASYGEELELTSQKTGMTTEQISALGVAAQLNQSSMDSMSTGLKLLQKNMEGAASGSPQLVAQFQALGVQFIDSTGKAKPVNDVLLQVAARFAEMPDGAAKTGAALALFGRSGSDLIPTLNSLGTTGLDPVIEKAKTLGLVMSEQDVQAASQAEKSLETMEASMKGLAVTVGSTLLPGLTSIVDTVRQDITQFTQFTQSHQTLTKATFDTAAVITGAGGLLVGLAGIVNYGPNVLGFFGNMATSVTTVGTAIGGLQSIYLLRSITSFGDLTAAVQLAGVGMTALNAVSIVGLMAGLVALTYQIGQSSGLIDALALKIGTWGSAGKGVTQSQNDLQAATQKLADTLSQKYGVTVVQGTTSTEEFNKNVMAMAASLGLVKTQTDAATDSSKKGTDQTNADYLAKKALAEIEANLVKSVTDENYQQQALLPTLLQLQNSHVSATAVIDKMGTSIKNEVTQLALSGQTIDPLLQKWADAADKQDRLKASYDKAIDSIHNQNSEASVLQSTIATLTAQGLIPAGQAYLYLGPQILSTVDALKKQHDIVPPELQGQADLAKAMLSTTSVFQQQEQASKDLAAARDAVSARVAHEQQVLDGETQSILRGMSALQTNAQLMTAADTAAFNALQDALDNKADPAMQRFRLLSQGATLDLQAMRPPAMDFGYAMQQTRDKVDQVYARTHDDTVAMNNALDDSISKWMQMHAALKFAPDPEEVQTELNQEAATIRQVFGQAGDDALRTAQTWITQENQAEDAITKKHIDSVKQTQSEVRDAAGKVFDDMFTKGQGVFNSLTDMFKGLGTTMMRTAFQDITSTLISPLMDNVKSLFNTFITGPLNDLMHGLISKITGDMSGSLKGISGMFGSSATGGIIAGGITAGLMALSTIVGSIGQGRKTADQFVQEYQNPFANAQDTGVLNQTIDMYNKQKTAGLVNLDAATQELSGVEQLWSTFMQNATTFAQQGQVDVKVVSQAYKTLNPLMANMIGQLQNDVIALQLAPVGATIKGSGITFNLPGTVAPLPTDTTGDSSSSTTSSSTTSGNNTFTIPTGTTNSANPGNASTSTSTSSAPTIPTTGVWDLATNQQLTSDAAIGAAVQAGHYLSVRGNTVSGINFQGGVMVGTGLLGYETTGVALNGAGAWLSASQLAAMGLTQYAGMSQQDVVARAGLRVGTFRTGVDYLGSDTIGLLHEGEAVLTKEQNAIRLAGGFALNFGPGSIVLNPRPGQDGRALARDFVSSLETDGDLRFRMQKLMGVRK